MEAAGIHEWILTLHQKATEILGLSVWLRSKQLAIVDKRVNW